MCAEHAARDAKLQKLEQEVKKAMGLGSDHRVAYADIFDALTSLQYHGKGWPAGMTEDVYLKIEAEALR